MERTPEQTVAYNDRAWAEKAPWHGVHYDCGHYGLGAMNPYHAAMAQAEGGGGMALHGLYDAADVTDSTLQHLVVKLANKIVYEVCPPGQEWAQMEGSVTAGTRSTQDDRRRLNELQTRTFKALHVSNGDQALHEMILDTVVFGTGVLRVGAGHEPAIPLSLESTSQLQVALEPGPPGDRPWGFHRKFRLPRDHIRAMWPDADLPDEEPMHEQRRTAVPPPRHTIYESTYYDLDARLWRYDVVARTRGRPDGERLLRQTMPIPRWVVWRWMRMPGEVYGRSPVMTALADAKTACQLVENTLAALSMAAGGIYTYTGDDVVNPSNVRWRPGTFIQVKSNARDNPSIAPLEIGGLPQQSALVLEDLRMAMTKCMLGESLPDATQGIRSATEWAARMRELAQALGAPFARLVEELLRPLLQAVVHVLSEQGVLEDVGLPPGENLLRLDGTDMDLAFTSQLIQSQKMQDAADLLEACGMAQQGAGLKGFEAAAHTPRIAAEFFLLKNVDPEMSRDPDEAEEAYQQMSAAEQAAPGSGPAAAPSPMEGMV